MLGWEYPPHISGGLGTACEGIARGLVENGHEVLFVLPKLFGDEDGRGAWLLSASDVPLPPDARIPAGAAREITERLQLAYVDSPLRPYQTAGDYSTMLRKIRRGVPRPTTHDRHAQASARSFDGGYGPSLASEVERFAHVTAELARRENFDVIHAHDWMTFPAGLLARRVSGRPLVCHVHASEYDRGGSRPDPGIVGIEQRTLASADAVVAVSEYTKSHLLSAYRLDADRVRVVHNAHSRRTARAVRSISETGRPSVLFLGRFTRQKGPETFLEAARIVATRHPNVEFVLAGGGTLEAELRQMAVRLGLSDRVRFAGFLDREEVEHAYARADLYVMPSASEPFGIASLEALSCDTPVIVSDRAGVTEAIPSAPTFKAGDPQDLAREIEKILFQPDHAKRLVAQGRAELGQLCWRTAGERLGEIYFELTFEGALA